MNAILIPIAAFGLFSVAVSSPATHAMTPTSAVVLRADSSNKEQTFGDALTLQRSKATTVSAALRDTTLHGKTILISGTIIDVCQNKGCWMVVTDGTSQMRVHFKDYAFFVPMNTSGRTVLMEGVVTAQEISEDDARHYAGESALPDQDPEKIHGAQQVVTMEAAAVVIEPAG